jgi:hypothetical protein
MTIRERILARADLADARAARDLDALAAGLNAQPDYMTQARYITARTILAECPDGGSILAALDAGAAQNAAVKYAARFLGQDSGLNVGDPATLGMLDALVPSVLTPAWAEQIKALAVQPVYVTRLDVEAAMYNPDGSEK